MTGWMFVFKTLEVTGWRGSPTNPRVQLHSSFPWKRLLCLRAVYHEQSRPWPLCARLPVLRHRTFWTSSSPWQLPTWDSALTCLVSSFLVFPYFVGICHTIFLLCCASVLISMALQSVADTCYQMQIMLCFPFEMISKNAVLLSCCLVAQS